jgi:hypothetical protein
MDTNRDCRSPTGKKAPRIVGVSWTSLTQCVSRAFIATYRDPQLPDMPTMASYREYWPYIHFAIALSALALPFIVGTIALHGLRDHIATFHGSDEELFHYPIILNFAETFPKMTLWDYRSAATPLFHIFFAILAKFVSPALPFLRAVNVVVSYLAGVILFLIFRKALGANFWTSLVVALTLILSPYVFGISFLLLTDNFALLFAACAIYFALLYLKGAKWNVIALAALFSSCAIMTRQLNFWLLPLLLATWVLRTRDDARIEPLSGIIALLALAVAPLVVLCIAWGGLSPPSVDAPGVNVHQPSLSFNLRPLTFFTACIGLYGAPLLAVRVWESPWRTQTLVTIVILAFLIAALLLPLPHCPAISCPQVTSDGYLWRASVSFPRIGETSLLFFVLVPFGVVTILQFCYDQKLLAVTVYFSYGLVALSNPVIFQKYFDLPALLVCCLGFYGLQRTRTVQIILLAYCVGFIAYAAGNPFS